jgi:hypothetical protein
MDVDELGTAFFHTHLIAIQLLEVFCHQWVSSIIAMNCASNFCQLYVGNGSQAPAMLTVGKLKQSDQSVLPVFSPFMTSGVSLPMQCPDCNVVVTPTF